MTLHNADLLPGMSTTGATIGRPATLPPELESARHVVLRIHDISLEATAAIERAGLGEWSANAPIVVLAALYAGFGRRPGELLESTKLTRGGLSNLLERMEKADLVSRRYGTVPGDRRGAIVTITSSGVDALNGITAAVVQAFRAQDAALRALADALGTFDHRNASTAMPVANDAEGPVAQLELLGRLGALIMHTYAAMDPSDPRPATTAVTLCAAADPAPTRPKELIVRTGLSSGGVSQLIHRLERNGMITRVAGHGPDHRAVIIELTDRGHLELERVLVAVNAHRPLIKGAFDDLIRGLPRF